MNKKNIPFNCPKRESLHQCFRPPYFPGSTPPSIKAGKLERDGGRLQHCSHRVIFRKGAQAKSWTITNISFVSGMNNKKPGFLAESRV